MKQIPSKSKISNGIKKTKIKVIGIGGGGGNIVSELAQRVKKVSFLAANTDLQALKEISRKVQSFAFGQSFTFGLGTGMNPEIAEKAAQNEKERIKKILQDQDLVIFIACLGGGTGSGATPVFAKISQNLGNLNYGIFTLPFKFEGEKKMEIAKKALEVLRPKLNGLTVLPNEKIFQLIDKNTPLKEAFSVINKNLSQSLEGLIETIYQPGLINIDFADLKTILEGRGRLAYLNTFSLPKKEGTIKEAAEKVLSSPLYPYGINGAKGVLFNIVGQKELSLQEISQISKAILEKANPEAKIIFGFSFEKKYKDIIKTIIFATGCHIPKDLCLFLKKTKTTTQTKISSNQIKKSPQLNQKKEINKQNVKGKSQQSYQKKSKKTEKKLPVSEQTEIEKKEPSSSQEKVEIKIRKNALQLRKEIEEEEKEIIEKEKFWEIPSFLRRK